MERKRFLIGLMGLGVNLNLHYPNYFAMIPTGPTPNQALTKGFFALGASQSPKPQTVAVLSADAEFSRNPVIGAKENTAKYGMPVPNMNFQGVSDMLAKYQAKAIEKNVDALGYYIAPLAYSQMQILEQAIMATASLDDGILSEYCRTNTFETVIGNVRFGEGGEWAEPRVVQVQFQNIDNNEIDTFRDSRVQVVVEPSEYASGSLIYPYSTKI